MYQIDFAKSSHVYFIGIGGISMSGLAELLLERNFTVSGSDSKESPLTDALERKGAVIHYSQRAENITDNIDLVVYTSAIHPDNPEYRRAVEAGIPMLSRAELLGQIMRNYKFPIAISGTHGKTTTTSMVSEILLAAGVDPTLSIGGILKTIGGNIRIGHSDYFVTEACEYTNSFLSFYPRYGIILNIDADHLDFFKDLDDIRSSFHRFAKLLPEDGALIINGDIPKISELTGDLACMAATVPIIRRKSAPTRMEPPPSVSMQTESTGSLPFGFPASTISIMPVLPLLLLICLQSGMTPYRRRFFILAEPTAALSTRVL